MPVYFQQNRTERQASTCGPQSRSFPVALHPKSPSSATAVYSCVLVRFLDGKYDVGDLRGGHHNDAESSASVLREASGLTITGEYAFKS